MVQKYALAHVHLVETPNGRGFPTHILKQNLLDLNYPLNQISTHSSIKEAVLVAERELKMPFCSLRVPFLSWAKSADEL